MGWKNDDFEIFNFHVFYKKCAILWWKKLNDFLNFFKIVL